MHLWKSHFSWLCNSIEIVRKCKQILTQHKRQLQAKRKYLEYIYICYWSKQDILIMKRKKPSKMAKSELGFFFQLLGQWTLTNAQNITWHSQVTKDRKAGQQFHSKSFICLKDVHSSTASTQRIINTHIVIYIKALFEIDKNWKTINVYKLHNVGYYILSH